MKRYFYLAGVLFLMMGSPAWAQQGPVSVFTATLQKTTFADRVEALGTLRANETVSLRPAVTETVTDVDFEDGQRVEKGDVLVKMTSSQEAALLEEAQSTYDEAVLQFERVKPLAEKGTAPGSLLDQRRREMETAQARLNAVKSQISDRIIEAPFSGVVGFRNVSVGALVSPNDVITTLDDDSVMKLDFSVPEAYLSTLRSGLSVAAKSVAFPGTAFEGEIASVGTQIDPVTRSLLVRAILPNDEQLLKPGLLMSITLVKDERQAILVPEESLIQEGGKSFVFVVVNGDNGTNVRKTEVTTGARYEGRAEITQGLEVGVEVVTHGTLKLRDGQAITVVASGNGDESLQELLDQQKMQQQTPSSGSPVE
ncbi:MAG: efflux RND transporter periplasmic adaptor subunit [Alphaproteobacteria bacterium]|nr:efflux RND transporter periplasmic adaptor subunit [Alphaproteobacteria bacterium]MCD8525837.1 efflux RND transporter periplasmic adaptor subunit [Alphaproteobacteria bacterium]MCD8571728.1 efflux RND transporter periplasmic adaptor subunit [Alphaproteobacteria bacterium]